MGHETLLTEALPVFSSLAALLLLVGVTAVVRGEGSHTAKREVVVLSM